MFSEAIENDTEGKVVMEGSRSLPPPKREITILDDINPKERNGNMRKWLSKLDPESMIIS